MRVSDILDHFLSRADWVDRSNTVDRVVVGDPELDVDRCLVAWMPSSDALREAAQRGLHLLMCHEPTFWDHRDRDPEANPRCADKLRFIRDHAITIVRNHDCWDRWPEVGIPWAWARFLELGDRPVYTGAGGYLHRYDIEPLPFAAFARGVAAHTERIGLPLVEASGAPDQVVSKVGVGTGCACDVFAYVDMGCDCCVTCDDGIAYWRQVQYAKDRGVPVICVNHGTSEEPGMAALTRYINDSVDGLSAEHLPQTCPFRLVGPEE